MRKLLTISAQLFLYILLFILLAAPMVVYWYKYIESSAPELTSTPLAQLPVEAVSVVAALIAALLMGMFFKTVRVSDFGLRFPKGIPQLITGTLFGAGLVALVLGCISLFGALSFNSGYVISFGVMAVAMIAVVSLNAIVQEIIFRGYFVSALRAKYSDSTTIITSSLIFVAAHAGVFTEEWPMAGIGAMNLFLAGVLMSVAYLRTGSLWFPIGIHIGWNLTQALLNLSVTGHEFMDAASPLILDGAPIITGGQLGIEGSAPGITGLLAGIALVFLLLKDSAPRQSVDA